MWAETRELQKKLADHCKQQALAWATLIQGDRMRATGRMSAADFRAGDVVHLKTREDALMVVDGLSEDKDKVVCVWLDIELHSQTDWFDPNCLVKR